MSRKLNICILNVYYTEIFLRVKIILDFTLAKGEEKCS